MGSAARCFFSLFFTHTSFIFSLILHPPFFISFSFVFLLLSLCFIFFLLFCQPPLSSLFIPLKKYIYNIFFLILFFPFSLSPSLFLFLSFLSFYFYFIILQPPPFCLLLSPFFFSSSFLS